MGDKVKDEDGYRGVFIERGASASQMDGSGQNFSDTISKILGMTGEARDAASAYTQVMVVDAPRLLKVPERVDVWRFGSFSNRKFGITRRSSGSSRKELLSHPLRSFLGERKLGDVPSKIGWSKVPTWECLHMHKKLRRFQSIDVDEIHLIGQTVEIIRCRLS